MSENPIERAIRRNLADKTMSELQNLEQVEVDSKDLERAVWEGVKTDIDINAPDSSVDSFHIVGSPDESESIKPTNIRFNISGLATTLANGALAIGGAASLPVLTPAAVVVICADLKRDMTVEITTTEAFVYWAIWRCGDASVRGTEVYELVNEAEEDTELNIAPEREEVEAALEKLVQIDSLAEVERNGETHYQPREVCTATWGVKEE